MTLVDERNLKALMPAGFQRFLGSDTVIDELPDAAAVERKFYFVSDQLFDTILQTRYKNAVRCSQKEVDVINAALGGTKLTTDDFLFERHTKCDCCQKQLNFFDVFQQAVKKHGVDFLLWAMLSPEKKIQVFPKYFKHEIECSECHNINTAVDYAHYSGSGYACA